MKTERPKICGIVKVWTDCGYEYDCSYEPDFDCDECMFVVSHATGDRRRGKNPLAKCNHKDRTFGHSQGDTK